jgi:hypothetical protein
MKQIFVSAPLFSIQRIYKGVALLLAIVTINSEAFSQNQYLTGGSSSQAEPSSVKPVDNPEHFTFLPGTLVGWSVELKDNKVKLSWSTTVEKNSKSFVILKSFDGKDFHEVSSTKAAGNSDIVKKYQCTDYVRSTKGNVYYRLQMLDNDLKPHLSEVKVINTNDEASELSLFPNPAVHELRVTVSNTWQGKELVFDIYNNYGQLVRHKKNATASQTERMNVADLPAGLYIVKVSNGGEKLTRQFIKSKS